MSDILDFGSWRYAVSDETFSPFIEKQLILMYDAGLSVGEAQDKLWDLTQPEPDPEPEMADINAMGVDEGSWISAFIISKN